MPKVLVTHPCGGYIKYNDLSTHLYQPLINDRSIKIQVVSDFLLWLTKLKKNESHSQLLVIFALAREQWGLK